MSEAKLKLKTPEEIATMRELGKVIAEILEKISDKAKSGVTLRSLDKYAQELCDKYEVNPSCKGYGGFPSVICAGRNDQAVHCIPDETKLEDGDILTIDIVIDRDGWFVDHATTLPIGQIDLAGKQLIDAAFNAREKAIALAVPGNTVGDLGYAMESTAKEAGCNVLYEMVGHGIGRGMHEYPSVPCFGERGEGIELVEGMVITIEPMLTEGSNKLITAKDGWSTRTIDKGRFAMFEHTLAITSDGPLVLTKK